MSTAPSSNPTGRPAALIILDGWGIAPPGAGNAVTLANTPVYNRIRASHPTGHLITHGGAVGLPEGQMGNSEVGHLNLGAGFVVRQELTRINEAVETGTLADNEVLGSLFRRVNQRGGALHLVGLLGDGGVHAHQRHLEALVGMAATAGVQQVAAHVLTDGRDTAPDSAAAFVASLETALHSAGIGRIASISGRFFGMDRDRRWPRVERAWRVIVDGEGDQAASAAEALVVAHDSGITDEFLPPTLISVADEGASSERAHKLGIRPEDGVVLFNFRADRMRQLLRALTDSAFDEFERHDFPAGGYDVVTMTRYIDRQTVPSAFPPQEVEWPLARVVSEAGLRQFHAAETEKYAHVTYFINGGGEKAFPREQRCMIPSPQVATYDLWPEMSAQALTDAVVARIHDGESGEKDDLIIVNFANPDMVGHTGVVAAGVTAIETVDTCLGRVLDALATVNGVAVVTADHGNSEQMIDPITGGPHTAHTTNPVPVVLVGSSPDHDPDLLVPGELPDGILADVAPTLLALIRIPRPPTMTGRSLLPAASATIAHEAASTAGVSRPR